MYDTIYRLHASQNGPEIHSHSTVSLQIPTASGYCGTVGISDNYTSKKLVTLLLFLGTARYLGDRVVNDDGRQPKPAFPMHALQNLHSGCCLLRDPSNACTHGVNADTGSGTRESRYLDICTGLEGHAQIAPGLHWL